MSRRRPLIFTIVAAVLAVAIGIVLSYVIHWFPAQASTQAHNTDELYHVLVIACIPIFVLVTTVILYSAWQFHVKPGEELKDGPPIHGNTRLEVFWTVLPAALLLGMLSYSFVVLHENEKRPAREITIGVTAQQFAWTFQYPPSVTGGAPLQTHELFLPENESVEFDLHSKDVIHAFWIPAFRLQEDVCNLLCGLGHSLMRSAVHVLPPARFQQWLSSSRSAAGSQPGGGGGGAGL